MNRGPQVHSQERYRTSRGPVCKVCDDAQDPVMTGIPIASGFGNSTDKLGLANINIQKATYSLDQRSMTRGREPVEARLPLAGQRSELRRSFDCVLKGKRVTWRLWQHGTIHGSRREKWKAPAWLLTHVVDLRPGQSPYPSASTFVLCRCMLRMLFL